MKEIGVKIGIVFFILVVFFSIKVKNNYQEKTIDGKTSEEEKVVEVAVTIDDKINYINLDDYLLGVVAGKCTRRYIGNGVPGPLRTWWDRTTLPQL